MKISQIKIQLKNLAKEFDLKYKEEWFIHMFVSKRENILIEYIWMCPDPIYDKYGKNPSEREKNIEKLINSKEFQELTNRYGGQVIRKKSFNEFFLKRIKNIENKRIQKEFLKIYKKIKNRLKNQTEIAVLTKSNIEKEKEFVKKVILVHEWVHVILFKNNINFNKYDGKSWQYNEGLVTFCQAFIGKSLDELEIKVRKETYPMEKQYYVYALKFKKLLENVNSPKERRKIILKKLKQRK